jgi:acetyltransferase-like isoleucine patch superfamily enzyme
VSRSLSWDWYPGAIPDNALVDETAYLETTFSFHLYRSALPVGLRVGRGASTYLGTMFDVGPKGRVSIGDYTLVHGARIVCDEEVSIGDYVLISWNVVLMDSYRFPLDEGARRAELEALSGRTPRVPESHGAPRPVRVERNAWLGFDSCILPGVTIGEGSIVGARSVVVADVPPFTVVAGNPAQPIRRLERGERRDA